MLSFLAWLNPLTNAEETLLTLSCGGGLVEDAGSARSAILHAAHRATVAPLTKQFTRRHGWILLLRIRNI